VKRSEVSNLNFLISSLPSIVFIDLGFTHATSETTTPKRLQLTRLYSQNRTLAAACEKAARHPVDPLFDPRIPIPRESAKLSWAKDGDMVDRGGMRIEEKAMV
jgi:hypothetical protein